MDTTMKSSLTDQFRTRDSRTFHFTLVAAVIVTCLASFLFYGTLTAAFLFVSTCIGYLLTSFFCFQPEGQKWRVELENLMESTFPSYLKPTDVVPEAVVANVKCHKEAQKIIRLIMRDFVVSWYDGLSTDKTFPEDVQRVLEHIALEVNLRLQLVDVDKMVSELVAIVIPYISVLNEVGVHGNKEFSTRHERCVRLFENNPTVAHRALRTPDAESSHYRHLVDVAIQCCLPSEYRSCGVATIFVREVLFHKVLRSLVDLLCDPDFLMAAIPLILDKAPPERVMADLKAMAEENCELDTPVDVPLGVKRSSPVRQRALGRSASDRVSRTSELSRGSGMQTGVDMLKGAVDEVSKSKADHESDGKEDHHRSRGKEDHHGLRGKEDHHGSRGKEDHHGSRGKEDHHGSRGKEDHHGSRGKEDHHGSRGKEDHHGSRGKEDPSSSRERWSKGRWKSRHPKGKEDSGKGARQGKDHGWGDKEEATIADGDQEPEDEEPAEEIGLAPIYITDHIHCKDRDGDYIGYIIKFPRQLLTPSSQQDLNLFDTDTHCVGLRRYSDFLKLRSTLNKSSLMACVKGIDLPDRHSISSILSKLPFKDMDPNILERKEGLERYLQTIAATDPVCTSDIFQNFLKSAVASKQSAGVTLPQEKFARKWSQRITLRGRSKESERCSELGQAKLLHTVLTDYLDTAAPLPCHHLNTLHTTHSGHPPLSRDHPPLSRDHPPLSRDHPPLSRDGIGAVMHIQHNVVPSLAEEVLAELSDPVVLTTPVGSVGSGCSLSCIEDGQGLGPWDAPIDHAHSPPTNFTPCSRTGSLCNEEVEEELTFGVRGMEMMKGSKVASVSREPEVTPGTKRSEVTVGTCAHPVPPANASVPKPDADPSPRVQPHIGGVWDLVGKLTWLASRVGSGLKLFLHLLLMGVRPITDTRVRELTQELEARMPLSNSLLSLATEAARLQCPRTCALGEVPQLGVLAVAGGIVERFLRKLLREVVYCENTWARAVYALRNQLWPNGRFIHESRPQLDEGQRKELVNRAVKSLKKFLPDALPYIVGPEAFEGSLRHCLECLQNKRINKHFMLRVIDHLMITVFPELMDKDFQRQLMRIRSTAVPSRKGTTVARL